jgi:hypothetical protein
MLGIPDLIAQSAKSVEDLAKATQAHPRSLYRVLQALAGVRLVTETEPGIFALEPAGRLLCGDVPGSLRSLAVLHGEEQYQAWLDIVHSVKAGGTGFARKFGREFFAYLREHPNAAAKFHRAMSDLTMMRVQDVLQRYDFSLAKVVLDVGGGDGSLLLAILDAYPHLQGIVVDLPEMMQAAAANIERRRMANRCIAQPGDFFAAIPSGADLFVLSSVLFDWDDTRAAQILRNVRAAMDREHSLLIHEIVRPERNSYHFSHFFDLNMMVVTGGQVRTEADHAHLLRQSGLELTKVDWAQYGAVLVAHPQAEGAPL